MPDRGFTSSTPGIAHKQRNQIIVLVVGACAFSFGLIGLIAFLLQPRYASNDDALLASLPSAGFSGVNEGQMVFVGPLFGYPLALLYEAIPSVQWYLVFSYGVLSLSLATLITCSALLSQSARIPITIGAIALWLGIFSQWFLNLNFTVYAFALASSGFALYVLALAFPRNSIALIILGSLLVGLGGTFRESVPPRPGVGLTVVLAMVPFLVLILIRLGKRRALILAGSLVASIVGAITLHSFVYRGPTWEVVFDWYKTSSILDTPARDAAFQYVERTNLSLNDYVLYYMNGWLDRSVYTHESMNDLYELASPATGSGEGLFYNPSLMWQNFFIYIQPVQYLLVPLFALILIGAFNISKLSSRFLFIFVGLVNIIWLLATFFYLGETRKVAQQILVPLTYTLMMLLMMMPTVLSNYQHLMRISLTNRLRRAALAFVPFLAIYALVPFRSLDSLLAESTSNKGVVEASDTVVANLREFDSTLTYVAICCAIDWGQNPKRIPHYENWPIQLVGGWQTFTPMWERRNEILGISDGVPKDPYGTTDLVVALTSNPKVRLIATQQAAGALSAQMKQYRGWKGCLNPIHRLPNDAVVYQAIDGNCAAAPPPA